MALTKTAAILDRNPHVVTSPRGVDAYGLYFEVVEANTVSGLVSWYSRIFIAGTSLSVYRRQGDTTRTTWKLYQYPTVEATEHAAARYLKSSNAVLRGAPILVQLEPVDIAGIADKKMPGARYRGNNKHEQVFGKLLEGITVTPVAMSARGFDATSLADAVAASKSAPAAVATPPSPVAPDGEPY